MGQNDLENQIDRVIKWLSDNDMIIKEGESERVKNRILKEIDNENSEDNWDDDIPSWAESAKNISGISINRENHNEKFGAMPRYVNGG